MTAIHQELEKYNNITMVSLHDHHGYDDIDVLAKQLDLESTENLVVFEYSYSYSRPFDEEKLKTILSEYNLNRWIITTSNFEYSTNKNSNIVYYPTHVIDFLKHTSGLTYDIKNIRDYYLGFITNYLHFPRLVSILKLSEQTWFDKCLFNFNIDFKDQISEIVFEQSCAQLNDHEKQLLGNFKKTIIADTNEYSENIPLDTLHSIKNRGFLNVYINMFTESNYDTKFITEKSFKPFKCGQFTAVLGANGLSEYLKLLGFDIFEEYININPLPELRSGGNCISLDDIRARLDITLQDISNMIPDITDIWNQTYIRRKHNQELCSSAELLNTLRYPLLNYLKNL